MLQTIIRASPLLPRITNNPSPLKYYGTLRTHRLVSLPFPEHIPKLLQRAPIELRFLPQIGRQEAVCVSNSDEGGFEGVFEGFGAAGG